MDSSAVILLQNNMIAKLYLTFLSITNNNTSILVHRRWGVLKD